jgi:hypothetical protein
MAMTAPERGLRCIAASVAILMATSACGRIGFDPSQAAAGASDAVNGDSSSVGDGATAGDTSASACAAAIPVSLNTRVAANTCDGPDRLDGCGPAGTREVIFKFVVPATGSYNFAAYDPGTSNVSNSTGVVDPTCVKVEACSGLYGTGLAAGAIVYFAVEASSGGCAPIEFSAN